MWLPQLERAEQVLRGLLAEGDICLLMGAGDVGQARAGARAGVSDLHDPPSDRWEREISRLRRFGDREGPVGSAEWFARVGSEEALLALLAWAGDRAIPVAVLGSGSNLLIADEGVAGLVIKLDRDLASIRRRGSERLACGGGVRLPALAAQAARAGLSGIEFGVNIPGTVGGAVRMNANAYGGQLAKVLESVAPGERKGG